MLFFIFSTTIVEIITRSNVIIPNIREVNYNMFHLFTTSTLFFSALKSSLAVFSNTHQ